MSNPTGYSLTQGDVYVSELAIAYGLSNRVALSTNLASILGLNDSERLNPNLDLKYLLISTDYISDPNWEFKNVANTQMAQVKNKFHEVLDFIEAYFC